MQINLALLGHKYSIFAGLMEWCPSLAQPCSTSRPQILLNEVSNIWYETHSDVSRLAAFFLWHGLASSTRRSYSSGQRSFISFAQLHPEFLLQSGKFLPATPRLLLVWVASLGHRALQPKMIKSYLSAVRSLHVDEGLSFEACESETVHRAVRGIKRFYGERNHNPKLPIVLSTLQRLTAVSGDFDDRFNVVFDAAIKVAWSGFLRCGEFTLGSSEKFNPALHLTRASITFLPSVESPTHVRLDLPGSKTDPFRKGVSILLSAASGASTGPVAAALKRLYQVHPQPATSPLFSNPDGSSLSRSIFISTLKARLLAIGLDSSLYSGHSFRRGAASAAATVGYADHEIQLLGRWRSDAYNLYIDVPEGPCPRSFGSSPCGRSPCSASRASGPSPRVWFGLSSAPFGSVRESLGFQIILFVFQR